MWWAIPAALSAISAISGMGASNAAADQGEAMVGQATDLERQKLALGQWQLDDFKQNILPMRNQMIADATGVGPTAAYGREAGDYKRGMAVAEQNILGASEATPSGLMSADLAGLDLTKAKGLAALRLNDDNRKLDQENRLLSIGYQTPGAVSTMQGAYDGGVGFYGNLANSYNQQAAAGYSGAAGALGSLAELFAKYGTSTH